MQSSTILTINKDGIIQSVDKNCCRLFGYDLDDLIGKPVKVIIPAPYREQHDSYIKNYLTTGKPKIIGKSRVVEGQHKDGSIFPIRLSVSKVGEGDNVIFIGMIDKLDDKSASVTINMQGQIVSCNPNVEELLGYKANDIIGAKVNLLMPPPYCDKHDQYIQNYLNGAPPKVIGKVRNVLARHKDGTVFPVSLQVEQLKIGSIHLFRGKLEQVEAIEAVFTIDSSGTIVSCNQNFVQPLCGYTAQDLVGQNITMLFPPMLQNFEVETPQDQQLLQQIGQDEPEEPLRKKQKTVQIADPPDELSLTDSWKKEGVQRKIMKHKDGSVFPINFEMVAFNAPDGKKLYSGRITRVVNQMKDDKSEKNVGPYSIVRTIGQGSYAKVKLAYHKDTKEEVAIKILQKQGLASNELERVKRETEILKQMDHPHIAKLYDVLETNDSLYLVMEYAGSTLLSYVLENHGLKESEARKFFKQVVSAVEHCHARNIIHRDLKHQNILLNKDNQTKLIDFGLSNFMEQGKMRNTFCGTPAYAAPEMILGKKYTGPEVDIWSLGVVLYSMITAVFPFEHVADIIKGDYKDPVNVSPQCVDLIRSMLQVDVKKRATIQQIKSHPWMTMENLQENGDGSVSSLESTTSSEREIKEIECTVVSTSALPPCGKDEADESSMEKKTSLLPLSGSGSTEQGGKD